MRKMAVTSFDLPYLKTPYYAQTYGCYWSRVIADRSFTLRQWEFLIFFAPITLTLTQWPSYTSLTRIPWNCTGWA